MGVKGRDMSDKVKLRWYETVARYLLGFIYLFGAADGIGEIFFHYYYTGESELNSFHGALQHTVYFWSFMKLCELLGAISLLANFRPALGLAIVTPISAVLCLFYVFELHWNIAFALVASLTLILLRAYSKSYLPLFARYS
jgi:hypothetical protein